MLGTLALLFAAIERPRSGSYGLSQRIPEIGIRMTLGADGRDVMRLAVRQALGPVAIGALVAVIGCAAVSQVLLDVLYGLGADDPVAFVGVPLFFLSAFLASYLPAARIEPITALRYE